MPRDLKLNSARFSKQSSKLVLEEHSHCEVPAGCGGVIMRWRDPGMLLFHVEMFALGKFSVALDGKDLSSTRVTIPLGAHVLSFAIEDLRAPFFFSATTTWPGVHVTVGARPEVRINSKADGTWLYTSTPPADDAWRLPGTPAPAWDAMIEAGAYRPDPKDSASWRIERLRENGAVGLKTHEKKGRFFVRKTFVLEGGAT